MNGLSDRCTHGPTGSTFAGDDLGATCFSALEDLALVVSVTAFNARKGKTSDGGG